MAVKIQSNVELPTYRDSGKPRFGHSAFRRNVTIAPKPIAAGWTGACTHRAPSKAQWRNHTTAARPDEENRDRQAATPVATDTHRKRNEHSHSKRV
ncbi:MAG: hypothetical protein HG459_000390 [Bacteroidia bacterium]|nr:hypothetical protein [Bacteroidia bacterium]MBB1539796.1 hypothetical protein [Bacteroidia bacterium]